MCLIYFCMQGWWVLNSNLLNQISMKKLVNRGISPFLKRAEGNSAGLGALWRTRSWNTLSTSPVGGVIQIVHEAWPVSNRLACGNTYSEWQLNCSSKCSTHQSTYRSWWIGLRRSTRWLKATYSLQIGWAEKFRSIYINASYFRFGRTFG